MAVKMLSAIRSSPVTVASPVGAVWDNGQVSEAFAERIARAAAQIRQLGEMQEQVFGAFGAIREVCDRPGYRELLAWLSACQWDSCGKPSSAWRWSGDLRDWLPVCGEHSAEYVLAA